MFWAESCPIDRYFASSDRKTGESCQDGRKNAVADRKTGESCQDGGAAAGICGFRRLRRAATGSSPHSRARLPQGPSPSRARLTQGLVSHKGSPRGGRHQHNRPKLVSGPSSAIDDSVTSPPSRAQKIILQKQSRAAPHTTKKSARRRTCERSRIKDKSSFPADRCRR